MSPEPYAQALWKALEGGIEPKRAVKALVRELEAAGRPRLLSRIGKVFARIAERELRKNRVTLTLARKADEAKGKHAVREILKELSAKDIDVRIDENIIGGWRLEGKGMLVDESFKKQLLSIYNRSIQ